MIPDDATSPTAQAVSGSVDVAERGGHGPADVSQTVQPRTPSVEGAPGPVFAESAEAPNSQAGSSMPIRELGIPGTPSTRYRSASPQEGSLLDHGGQVEDSAETGGLEDIDGAGPPTRDLVEIAGSLRQLADDIKLATDRLSSEDLGFLGTKITVHQWDIEGMREFINHYRRGCERGRDGVSRRWIVNGHDTTMFE